MKWFLDKILEALDWMPRVKVFVHEAFLLNNPEPYYFVKVINSSPKNVFTITHVWFIDGKEEKDIINTNKPLPSRLEASDIWETWFPKKAVNSQDRIFNNIRVVLSNGKTYKSKKNKSVRPIGFVS